VLPASIFALKDPRSVAESAAMSPETSVAEPTTAISGGRLAAVRPWWTAASARPAIATARLMGMTAGLLYMTGGGMVLVALPHAASQGASLATAILGLVAIAIGGASICLRASFPPWAYHCHVVLGTLIISALICLAGGGTGSLTFGALFTFVAIDCSLFFGWPAAVAQLVLLQLCSFFAFVAVGLPLSELVLQQGCATVVGLVVGWLARAAAAAERDALTGLINRRGFEKAMRQAVSDAAPTSPLSLVLLDFDHFKWVNDRGGHASGDRLLKVAARRWESMTCPGQILTRLGGDEFALIVPGCRASQAAALADELRAAVAAETSCSAGVAEFEPKDSQSMLVSRADAALYEAKSKGRDQTVQHGIEVRADAAEMLAAIGAAAFQVWYQPIIEMGSGTVIGEEALARWDHPQLGLLSPSEFISAAERNGAIHSLGAWVLREACTHGAEIAAASCIGPYVAVNASGCELRSSDYCANVADILTDAGLAPVQLVIEVTESMWEADQPEVIDTLRELRALGVRIAIDDFGTGYSSLSRLSRLPVDILKIDRSFIGSLSAAGTEVPILRAIIALADALNLSTIAEGIETEHQAAILEQLGCTYAQGYLYGRPRAIAIASAHRRAGLDSVPVITAV
jgi:diguanylate cyclase (GGDEF)-like protein